MTFKASKTFKVLEGVCFGPFRPNCSSLHGAPFLTRDERLAGLKANAYYGSY
jgi:hypothetical protein